MSILEEMGWLDGYSVLITGGGSGLGRGLVTRFLDEGARVAVLEKSEQRVADLRENYASDFVAVAGDVRDYHSNVAAVQAAVDAFGRLDVFIGNAGVWDFSTSLVDLEPAQIHAAFNEIFGVNVKACLLGVKAALPQLASNRGSVIFTLSNGAFYPGGGGVLYTASKHALVGVVRQLAHEFAPTVRVNGVAPGAIASDLRGPEALGRENESLASIPLEDLMQGKVPLDWLPEPEEYAGHYVLLASRENSGTMTGEVIECDGGMSARGISEAAQGAGLPDRFK